MNFQGNWIDLIILVFLLFYVWEGWARGFIYLLADLIAFVAGFLLSLKFYSVIAMLLVTYFAFPKGIANAAGFILVGVFFEQLFAYTLGLALLKVPFKWTDHLLNKIFSFIPLILNALIIIAFILTLAIGLPIKPEIKAAISGSQMGSSIISRTQRLEKTLGNIFGGAVTETYNFLTITPTSHENVKLNFTQKELSIDQDSEEEMLIRVNKERRDRGLKELKMDRQLQKLARIYAQDMFERGYFSHYNPEGDSPFDRMDQQEITYIAAGENLAYAPNVTIAHEGLMDSPGHRANILSTDYGKVGIGVIDGGIYGKMFVQEFTD